MPCRRYSASQSPRQADRRLHLYGSGLAWAFFDITEKSRLESIAEAVETMNNIGYVFSAVRHELGNPINSVKAGLSVLRANIDTFSRSVVIEYVDRLSSELSRVEVLLRSLRNFSMYDTSTGGRPLPILRFWWRSSGSQRRSSMGPGRRLARPRALQQRSTHPNAVGFRDRPTDLLDAGAARAAHITVRTAALAWCRADGSIVQPSHRPRRTAPAWAWSSPASSC
jgi:signal transduction histidine kinase